MLHSQENCSSLRALHAAPLWCSAAIIFQFVLVSLAAGDVTLEDATYTVEYGVYGSSTPVIITYPLPPQPAIQSPVPIAAFTDTGLISGTYFIAPETSEDQIFADTTIDPPSFVGGVTNEGLSLSATTTYQVAVIQIFTPPVTVTAVPVITEAAGFAKVSPQVSGPLSFSSADATAVVSLSDATGKILFSESANSLLGPPTFDVKTDVFFGVAEPVSVDKVSVGSIIALVAGPNSGVPASFSASVDPMFQIDPSFPYAKDFQLIYSRNIAVPEPSTLFLLGVSVACLAIFNVARYAAIRFKA